MAQRSRRNDNAKVKLLTAWICAWGPKTKLGGACGLVVSSTEKRAWMLAGKQSNIAAKSLMMPLIGEVDAYKAMQTTRPQSIRIRDIGLPDDAVKYLEDGFDVVILFQWYIEAAEALTDIKIQEPGEIFVPK